LNNIWKA